MAFSSKFSFLFYFLILLTAFSLWAFHFWFLLNLFENVRFFSHLSDFEREMTYRTEMGFYFSFYKTLVSMPFSEGFVHLLKDNTTEFGSTINALHRFNLYPEVVLSLLFSTFKRLSEFFEWQNIVCWRVNRGGGMPPVESCEGAGNLHYFYIYGAFFVASSVLFSLFIGGFSLSKSYFGAILAVCAFMFNHGEATRAQWTPPLRETFGYPIFLLQTILIGYIIRKGNLNIIFGFLHIFLTVTFCCFWQLSQFVIGIQLGTLVLLYSLELISFSLIFSLWKLFLISYCLSIFLLFGNLLMINSLFLSSIIAFFVIFIIRLKILKYLKLRPIFIFLHIFIYLLAAISIKFCFNKIFNLQDDNNVFDLLKAKLFPNFANFHTLLYTCAPEFDFLQFETISKLISTWLLPLNCLVILFLSFLFYRYELANGKWLWRLEINKKEKDVKCNNDDKRFCPEIAYHFIQLCLFSIMALLFMRLKLFATPHLCLLSSLLANKNILSSILKIENIRIFRIIFVGILLAGMSNQGIKNIKNQLEMTGEYNNPEQERLFIWINKSTSKDAVFAGTMALMANLKLSTLRPIVNHPHYENEEIRKRTLRVYSLYSRKSVKEVYSNLKNMGIQFYVFQPQQCLQKHPKKDCSYLEMWDLQEPKNRNNLSLCHNLWNGIITSNQSLLGSFLPVYVSESFVVFKL